MTFTAKRALTIGLPVIAGVVFLYFYLRKSGKEKKYVPEQKPEKAKENPAKEPAPVNQSSGYPLKNGVYNSSLVAELQTILNGAGAKLTVDGDFGPKTESALQTYYGKKQIDSGNDFNAFKLKVQSAGDVNVNTSRAQQIINSYKSGSNTQVYTTAETTGQVAIVNTDKSYFFTGETLPFPKLLAFAHDKFVPKGMGSNGYLIAEYDQQNTFGNTTYTLFVNPNALAVK
jgi:peptidoglycan hydrolase-like protein with peptidoglycan-binding domain